MRKFATVIFFCLSFLLSSQVFAMLSLELTRGVAGAIPIAIVPFDNTSSSDNVSTVISNDLQNSGRFKVYTGNSVTAEMPASYFKSIGASNVVSGSIQKTGSDQYQVSFTLSDVAGQGGQETHQVPVLSQKFVVTGRELRSVAHHISDLIYRQLTGVRGVFSTRLAYIVVQRSTTAPTRYALEVADQDGYNPRVLLTSPDPIMSPAWSPNGKQVAYVSFEKKHAAIFVQDLSTGSRQLLTEYPGINGAPAWSPDGRKLAIVLSKDGSPNIYSYDLNTRQLNQLTSGYAINTEPSWSPDGRLLIFTSNRSGGPQIYQKNMSTGAISRLTYEGNYNARASFSPDGSHIVMLNQQSKLFNIGILDLDNSVFHVLTNSSGTDNESPSVAPNGSMILYGTLYGGRSVLGMVASDGSVQVRLPARNGEVQDPAWSPFLS